jgi:hypothetical protein
LLAERLKPDDLRLKLIAHALAPGWKPTEQQFRAGARPPSAVKRQLVEALRARDIRASLHLPIGDHIIDVVAEGHDGDRVAIQCDGGRAQSEEQLAPRSSASSPSSA